MSKRKISSQAIVTPAALQDIQEIVQWSIDNFGRAAAIRYRALINQALRDIEIDPTRSGSKDRSDIIIGGAHTYHLSLSRANVKGERVKQPRHFILYRLQADNLIEVARILHDSCDLPRHLPEDYPSSEDE